MVKKISVPKTPRAAVRKPRKPAAAKKSPFVVAIDYPQENEAVRPGHYSIRLTAAGASAAQARLDGGEWRDCREAVGHYWLDWAPRVGRAKIEARARAGKGRWSAAPARSVVVAE
jgi:hypothetical protein